MLFGKKKKTQPPRERRSQSVENLERRKVFDEHDKRAVQMKTVDTENKVETTNRRLEAIEANLRAIRRRGIPQ